MDFVDLLWVLSLGGFLDFLGFQLFNLYGWLQLDVKGSVGIDERDLGRVCILILVVIIVFFLWLSFDFSSKILFTIIKF